MNDTNFSASSNLQSLIVAKNLLQTATFKQLWIFLASAGLSSYFDTIRNCTNLPGGSVQLLSLLTHSSEDCLWLKQLSLVLIFLFANKREKTATLGGLYPSSVFMLVYISRKAITTCSFDLWIHLNSFKSLLCSWKHYWTLLCRYHRDLFIDWEMTGYFLIWNNCVHDFFFLQFLSRLIERSGSQNSCNHIKLNKAIVSIATRARTSQFVQYNLIVQFPHFIPNCFHYLFLAASDNWKFCKSINILGNFLLDYFMSTQRTLVLSQSCFEPFSNMRTQKSESFSCTVRNHLWLKSAKCGKELNVENRSRPASFTIRWSSISQKWSHWKIRPGQERRSVID